MFLHDSNHKIGFLLRINNFVSLGRNPRHEPAVSDDAYGHRYLVRIYVARSNATQRNRLFLWPNHRTGYGNKMHNSIHKIATFP